MPRLSRILLPLVFATGAAAASAECLVSRPEASPVTVPGMGDAPWFGSESLAVRLPAKGRWYGTGSARRFRDKTWFWRQGYVAASEPRPDLEVTGVKLGDEGTIHTLSVGRATNAFGPAWQQMLVLVEFPSAGCWRVSATYVNAGIRHDLDFVVDVADR